jgi:hypothetical protein
MRKEGPPPPDHHTSQNTGRLGRRKRPGQEIRRDMIPSKCSRGTCCESLRVVGVGQGGSLDETPIMRVPIFFLNAGIKPIWRHSQCNSLLISLIVVRDRQMKWEVLRHRGLRIAIMRAALACGPQIKSTDFQVKLRLPCFRACSAAAFSASASAKAKAR